MCRSRWDRSTQPLCKCGCGEPVPWSSKKGWLKYVRGHYAHNSRPGSKPPDGEAPPLCACGCGKPVAWDRRIKGWSRFRKAHHRRKHGDPAAWDAKAAKANERMLRVYGITRDEYEQRLRSQGSRCAICEVDNPGKSRNGKPSEFFCIDHDHETGTVRGLLCRGCNASIGLLNDDPRLVRRALEYLTQ